jgi:hypothetical protein
MPLVLRDNRTWRNAFPAAGKARKLDAKTQKTQDASGRIAMRTLRAAAVVVGVAALLSAPARAQEPFYKGKRLSILINFAPGGPTDIEGRLFAKHLARHIDGAPNLVIQNMEGAGGIVGAKYLG